MSLFIKYQTMLRDLGMLDLDDLEVETLRLFNDHPDIVYDYAKKFPWIFVDEYQDTNPTQVELLKTLIRAGENQICAIGDPDQRYAMTRRLDSCSSGLAFSTKGLRTWSTCRWTAGSGP